MLLHRRIRAEFLIVGSLDAVGPRPSLQGLERRHHQGAGEVAPLGHNHRELDQRAALEAAFDRRRRDVLPARGLEQVLLAVGDGKVTVLVQVADVPGVEPVPFHDLSGLLLHLEVALHDVRAADEDFAILGNAHLNVRDDRAYRAESERVDWVDGDQGGRFGQAIGLADRQSQRIEELGQVFRQRGGPGHKEADPAAQPAAQLGEDELVGHAVLDAKQPRQRLALQAVRRRGLAHANRPVKQVASDGRGGGHRRHHAVVDLFEESRNADRHGGPDLAHVGGHGVHRLRIRHRDAAGEIDIVRQALGDMAQRQERQGHIVRFCVDLRVTNVGADVGMRQHHALGNARRARRVDDARQIAGLDRLQRCFEALPGRRVGAGLADEIG